MSVNVRLLTNREFRNPYSEGGRARWEPSWWKGVSELESGRSKRSEGGERVLLVVLMLLSSWVGADVGVEEEMLRFFGLSHPRRLTHVDGCKRGRRMLVGWAVQPHILIRQGK